MLLQFKTILLFVKQIKELEKEVKQLKSSKTDSSKLSSKRGVPLTNGATSKPQERYFSLEAEKFERMAAGLCVINTVQTDWINQVQQM